MERTLLSTVQDQSFEYGLEGSMRTGVGVNWAYTFTALLSGINCQSKCNNPTVIITLMLDATSRPNSDGISLRDKQDYIRIPR